MKINKKFYTIISLFVIVILQSIGGEPESFVVSKDVVLKENAKAAREKKYSEIQEDLMHLYEEILRLQIQKMHELADAQDACVDALKKIIENMPQMSRQRVEKELSRMQKLRESLNQITFF